MFVLLPAEVLTNLAWLCDFHFVGTLRRICTNSKAGTEVLFLTHHLLYLVAKQRELFGPTPALLDGEIGTWGAAARWTGAVYVQLLPWQFPALVAPLDGDISSWGAAERWTGAVYEQLLPWEFPALENGEKCIWGAATRWTGVIGMVSNKRSREDYPPPLLNQLRFDMKIGQRTSFSSWGPRRGDFRILGIRASAFV